MVGGVGIVGSQPHSYLRSTGTYFRGAALHLASEVTDFSTSNCGTATTDFRGPRRTWDLEDLFILNVHRGADE